MEACSPPPKALCNRWSEQKGWRDILHAELRLHGWSGEAKDTEVQMQTLGTFLLCGTVTRPTVAHACEESEEAVNMSAEVCVRDGRPRSWFSVARISNMDAEIRETEAKKFSAGQI